MVISGVILLVIRYFVSNGINKATDSIGNAYSRKKNEESDEINRIADEHKTADWKKDGRRITRGNTFNEKQYIFSVFNTLFPELLDKGLKTMNLDGV